MKHRWWRSKKVIGDKVVIDDGQFYLSLVQENSFGSA
jgi:hypothetical protein